jgi:hypothetical protein
MEAALKNQAKGVPSSKERPDLYDGMDSYCEPLGDQKYWDSLLPDSAKTRMAEVEASRAVDAVKTGKVAQAE